MPSASIGADGVQADVDDVAPRRPLTARDRTLILLYLAIASFALFAVATWARIGATDSFDRPFSSAINHFARRSALLDQVMAMLDRHALFQGVPLIALGCSAFVSTQKGEQRVALVIGCVAAALAALLSRGLQLFLPHLPRPLFDPALPFQPPYGADLLTLKDWSSFPSDHAALLWGIAVATLLISRPIGALALVIGAVSSLARVYGGQHYASDVLGGGFLAAGLVCGLVAVTQSWAAPIARLAPPRRAVLAALGFVAASQAATLFDDVRSVAREATHQVTDVRGER